MENNSKSKKFNNLKDHKINKKIRAKWVFLIDQEGQKVGEVSIFEAMDRASAANLDLVEMAVNGTVPVCKIMDYGKFCFINKKNSSKSRKDNKFKETKEIQVRPNIEENDFKVKLDRLHGFLNTGYKVNIILKFKGRQIIHSDIGLQVLERFIKESEEIAKVDSKPVLEGKRANMLLSPKKTS